MEFSWFEFVGYRVLPERLSYFSVLKRIMQAAQKKNTHGWENVSCEEMLAISIFSFSLLNNASALRAQSLSDWGLE